MSHPHTPPAPTASPAPAAMRTDVLSMQPYAVPDTTGLVKLDAMENPFTLPPALQAELGQRLGGLAINRYPGGEVRRLHAALHQYLDIPPGCGLVLGNGSDEIISMLATLLIQPASQCQNRPAEPACIMALVPGFVMYQMSAQLLGLRFVGVPLAADFELDEAALLAAIAQHRPALLFLAYPNNPTGTLWNVDTMHRCMRAVGQYGGIVVVDEAYQPFASATWLDAVRAQPDAHRHVVVMRTFSKWGLAGVRLGYAIAPQPIAHALEVVRPPYNVSVLNAECALFALEHADVFAGQAATIRTERARLHAALAQHPHYHPYPSQGNMLLVRCQQPQFSSGTEAAAHVYSQLRTQGMLIKNVSTMHPLLHGCIRLTVGTPDENTALIAALQAL